VAAGCGSSPTQQVRVKVQQFAVAVAHRDAKTICMQVFAPSLVKRFASAGLSCERGLQIFFSGVRHPTLAVGRVQVHGARASAMTLSGASGQTASLRPVELVKTSDGWRIAALGAPVKAAGSSR
jgi:non-ribosomal peptide synthetase component F